jgi:NADH-quinone oxidoreductase subunit M
MENSILSLLIWLPIFGGGLVILLGNERAVTARWVSLAISILVFVMSLSLWTGFDSSTHLMQFEEFNRCINTIIAPPNTHNQ